MLDIFLKEENRIHEYMLGNILVSIYYSLIMTPVYSYYTVIIGYPVRQAYFFYKHILTRA